VRFLTPVVLARSSTRDANRERVGLRWIALRIVDASSQDRAARTISRISFQDWVATSCARVRRTSHQDSSIVRREHTRVLVIGRSCRPWILNGSLRRPNASSAQR
jgi:hypothetical protein